MEEDPCQDPSLKGSRSLILQCEEAAKLDSVASAKGAVAAEVKKLRLKLYCRGHAQTGSKKETASPFPLLHSISL